MPRPTHAISIRQPFVELILRRIKTAEYRDYPTNIRGRVYLYAARKPVDDPARWRQVEAEPGELPTGVILGTVEIVDCRWDGEAGVLCLYPAGPQAAETEAETQEPAQPVLLAAEISVIATDSPELPAGTGQQRQHKAL